MHRYLVRALERIKDIQEFCQAPENQPHTGELIIGAPSVAHEIHAVALDAARIGSLLYEIGPRDTRYRRFSEDRVAFFSEILSCLEITELRSRGLRNSIEHLSERIDKMHQDFFSRPIEARRRHRVFQGIFFTSLKVLDTLKIRRDDAVLIELMTTRDMLIYNFDAVLDVKKLKTECETISSTLISSGILGNMTEQGDFGAISLLPWGEDVTASRGSRADVG